MEKEQLNSLYKQVFLKPIDYEKSSMEELLKERQRLLNNRTFYLKIMDEPKIEPVMLRYQDAKKKLDAINQIGPELKKEIDKRNNA